MTINITRRNALAGLGLLALPACRSSKKGFDAEVIVLGAGLSGLHAARLLEEEGKDVLVLEASTRIGGRMHTLEHGALGYTEGGGEQVGASYARILHTADLLGVALSPDVRTRQQTSFFYKDKLYAPGDWKTLAPHPFPAPFSGASPAAPLFALAAKENPLASASDWRDPKFESYDISVEDFLKSKGFDDEARRVIDVAFNGNSLQSYSMINLYRTLQTFAHARGMGPSLSIKGGAQRLPEAMSKSLARPVKTGKLVTSITVSDQGVALKTAGGETYRAQHCISSIPFAAMRKMALNAPLNDMQKNAISQLPYTQIYQVHFQAETRFWETDGLPTDMWTDSPIERIFANVDANGKPNGLFRAWINGAEASLWASKDNQEVQFKSDFKKVRPASEGRLKILSIQNWTTSNPLAGGAYMHWEPHQIPLMASKMGARAGRLFFSGEHLSYLHTGMEGAMESGENAAYAILDI